MKTRLAIGFVLVLLCVIPTFVNAYEIEPLEYPVRDKINVPRLLMFKASLHLQGDEVQLRLSAMNRAKRSLSFLMGCKVPCFPSGNWGHPHSGWIILEPHKKFTWSWKVRPCEDGGRTRLVPVYIRIWILTYPEEHIYSGDFTLEIPERWQYIPTY